MLLLSQNPSLPPFVGFWSHLFRVAAFGSLPTFCRGLLQALGHAGPVRSPTYTIIESYQLAAHRVHHLDLYRLADAEELEYIGGRDLFSEPAVTLIEWPERGQGWLPTADIAIRIEIQGQDRLFSATASTAMGQALLEQVQKL